jgi:hypothetical protein
VAHLTERYIFHLFFYRRFAPNGASDKKISKQKTLLVGAGFFNS